MPELPSGTVTFLFTDIERSTETVEAMGNERYADALDTHRQLLRDSFKSHEGHEVGTEGDSFFVAFARAQDAVAAAVAGQRALESHELAVRMGIHTGEALVRGGDYVGHDVHKAKRICDAAHGGQIVLSEAAADLVRQRFELVDLGAHRLKDLQEAQRIFQVVHDALRREFPPLRSLDTFRHNLPLQRTTFIGREREIAKIREQLAAHRLVTLTGIGGAGKTRLALQVGAELLDDFADGVFFVDLGPVSDPDAIVPAIARAVGLQLGVDLGNGAGPAGSPEQRLLAFLSHRTCLVILDNCEHLLDGCADIADQIVGRCPDVTLLATSREGLAVDGEQLWQTPSLSTPDDEHAVQNSEAVSLFRARANAVRPDFELTPQNVGAVAEICRRLDGIPLAIEFAASRVAHMSPEEIASRLSDMFRLLAGGRRRVQRQQTLQAALDWSYDLLTEPERTLLGRLAVFAGDFSLQAAEDVCAGGDVDRGRVLDLLGSLVSKSLVTIEEHRGTTRYRLMETVRMYASEKLRESGESDDVRTRHRDWYLAWIESIPWAHILLVTSGPDPADELPNLRSALEWSEAQRRPELVMRIAARLHRVWLGEREEGFRWLTRYRAEDLDLSIEDKVAALTAAQVVARNMPGTDWLDLGERSVAAAQGTTCAPLITALIGRALGRAVRSVMTGDPALAAQARADVDEAMRIARSGHSEWLGHVTSTRGGVATILGDLVEAEAAFDAALGVERYEFFYAALGLATAAHLLGHHEKALDAANHTLDRMPGVARFAGTYTSFIVSPIAVAIAGSGDLPGAWALLRRHEGELIRPVHEASVVQMTIGIACVAQLAGDNSNAARLLAWVRSRTLDMGAVIPSAQLYALYSHYVRRLRQNLGAEEAHRLRNEGRAMSDREAVSCALETIDA
jgi:predicted ATPase/class 3 adenylate cyclase